MMRRILLFWAFAIPLLWPLAFVHPAWAEAPHPHAGDTEAPEVSISAPASSDDISVATITSPTQITGTARDANLAQWQLLISESGKNQWSELAAGTSSITDSALGQLQTQTIANGLYDIGLIATDTSGQQSSARITVEYDAAGQQTRRTNALGHSWQSSYSAAGQITSATNALGRSTTYQYDLAGRQTQYSYDSHGRHNQTTDSRDGAEQLSLDALGRVTTRAFQHSATQLAGSSSSRRVDQP